MARGAAWRESVAKTSDPDPSDPSDPSDLSDQDQPDPRPGVDKRSTGTSEIRSPLGPGLRGDVCCCALFRAFQKNQDIDTTNISSIATDEKQPPYLR